MNPYLYNIRLPLFLNEEEIELDENKEYDQLDSQPITVPISYTLLGVIHHTKPTDGSNKHINALLDEIIKSPSYFFPEIPLSFEREGIYTFVPDDGENHWLNWKSIILQIHISFLNQFGWEQISDLRSSKKSKAKENPNDSRNRVNFLGTMNPPSTSMYPSSLAPGRENLSKYPSTGSIFVRSQSKCIGSFSNKIKVGSMVTPSLDEYQYTIAPPINRTSQSEANFDDSNLELNQLFNFQLQCSFDDSPLFRSIILAIASKGLLDKSLGLLLSIQLKEEITNCGIQAATGKFIDPSSSFDDFYNILMKTLLPYDEEDQINSLIAQDKVEPIIHKFESLQPFYCVPHAHKFIESILAPLCFHENPTLAKSATKLLMTLYNGHSWDLKSAKVITADTRIELEQSSEHVLILSGPSSYGNHFSVFNGKVSFEPLNSGFYDYCYGRISQQGDLEVDSTLPSGRYIVLPSGARKEIIHELPAFDERDIIKFSDLESKLETLVTSGATAVHVTGAIERNFLHDLTSVTDHTVFSKKCGGLAAFKKFCNAANRYSLRVLIDFSPLVCLRNGSKKYAPFGTVTADYRGRLLTADIPETEMMLLNYRQLKLWDLLTDELLDILDACGVSGFYIGSIEHWDTVFPRDLQELMRLDPDDTPHYQVGNVIEGTIVSSSQPDKMCNLMTRGAEYSPYLFKIMQKIWSRKPDAFVWTQCDMQFEPFAIKSGLIPANYAFRNVIQCAIEYSVREGDVDRVNSNESLIKLYQERKERNPEGSLLVAPFGALMDGPFNLPNEGIALAIDLLFYLTDVPLISGCLETAMFYANAYSTIKQVREKNAKWPEKWWPNCQRFRDLLKNRSSTRAKADWALSGDVQILPVSYSGKPMRAVLSFTRTASQINRCCLICTSFYMYNLIYEVSVKSLPIFNDKSPDSVVEVKPISGAASDNSYYSLSECQGNDSAFFLELANFATAVYEINIIEPPIPPNIRRSLIDDVYTRLERAIIYESKTVLSNNKIYNQILKSIENESSEDKINKAVSNLPKNKSAPKVFLEAFYYATRNKRDPQTKNLVELQDEHVIESREHAAMKILHNLANSPAPSISGVGKKALELNELGPILFVAPELGPFSKVGGLSTMVWELAKELANLGLDIHVISPYYNVSPKGETNYLKKYGIEYKRTIDVYCPSQTTIGIHYGLVDGVKCWFLHHYSYFAAPYQTGSCSFRLQLLVVMAKAALELCCQVRIIPSLIVSNDWMTGLIPAMGKNHFGSVFDKSKFLHIFHNLGVGYAGKIWPNNGDTGSLRYIHQLPDELIVDNFDHSIDPSLCALLQCDQWATVSKKYRQELLESSPYNWILSRFPRPFAYSNGIRFKERLENLSKLGLNHIEAKRVVQKKYFDYVDDDMCLFVFVGRIVEQKGVYLIIDSFEELNRQYKGKLMFIVGGQAAPDDRAYGLPCTQKMWDLKNRYPKQFWADPSQFFADGLLCCQAADFTMIPSLFEPSGIVQQEAFASGCPVIAFKTGGLADTVFEFDREKLTGNGFVFLAHRHYDFMLAMQRAVAIFEDKKLYKAIRENAFKSTLSTETVAIAWSREFARLFMKIFERKENVVIVKTIVKEDPPKKVEQPKKADPVKPPDSLALDVKKYLSQKNASQDQPQAQKQAAENIASPTAQVKQEAQTQSSAAPVKNEAPTSTQVKQGTTTTSTSPVTQVKPEAQPSATQTKHETPSTTPQTNQRTTTPSSTSPTTQTKHEAPSTTTQTNQRTTITSTSPVTQVTQAQPSVTQVKHETPTTQAKQGTTTPSLVTQTKHEAPMPAPQAKQGTTTSTSPVTQAHPSVTQVKHEAPLSAASQPKPVSAVPSTHTAASSSPRKQADPPSRSAPSSTAQPKAAVAPTPSQPSKQLPAQPRQAAPVGSQNGL